MDVITHTILAVGSIAVSYYAGAYWKYGFHEDGVKSALDVCRHFGVESI